MDGKEGVLKKTNSVLFIPYCLKYSTYSCSPHQSKKQIILSILYLSFSLYSKPSQLIHAEQSAPQNDPSCAVGKGLRSTWDAHRTQQGFLPDQTHVCHLTTFLPVTRTQKKSGQKMSPYVARTSGLKFGHGINPQIIPTEYN